MSPRYTCPPPISGGSRERPSAQSNRREATGPLDLTPDGAIKYIPPPQGRERLPLTEVSLGIDSTKYDRVNHQQLAEVLHIMGDKSGRLILSGDGPTRQQMMSILSMILQEQAVGHLMVDVTTPEVIDQLPMLGSLAEGWGVPLLINSTNGYGPNLVEQAMKKFAGTKPPVVLGVDSGLVFQSGVPVINL